MNEEMIERSPEAMNDPENIVFKRENRIRKEEKFVKSYDQIKEQLEEVKKKYENCPKVWSEDAVNELNRLETIEVVLNWVLRNDNSDLI